MAGCVPAGLALNEQRADTDPGARPFIRVLQTRQA